MGEYKPTIGLEIHAEMKTRTKMFCDSKNDTDETRPNMNVCPVCMGHPGTLPVINKEAVKHVLRVGVAVEGEIADYTEFDRKNYFYPDIPKGYQISQYKYPLVKGGEISGVKLTRVHLEEDTAKNFHKGDHSLVDFNRAGIPLMEIVTEPDIKSGSEAAHFAKELQLLLRYLGAGGANMEKGELRVEANISLLPRGNSKFLISNSPNKNPNEESLSGRKLGTKVEIKNLNSFRSVERAIAFEIERQSKLLEEGEEIVQETRGWDEGKQKTFSQRQKEGSEDYRYFPDPDLPKLKLSEIGEFAKENLQKELPELPWDRRERYRKEFSLKDGDADFFVQNRVFGALFEAVAKALQQDKEMVQLAANYIVSDLRGLVGDESEEIIDLADNFAELIRMVKNKDVSSRGAKDILALMIKHGGSPKELAEKEGLIQKSNEGELREIAQKIIAENKQVAEDFKAGKEKSLQFLIGQAMKEMKGAANPQVLDKIFRELLG